MRFTLLKITELDLSRTRLMSSAFYEEKPLCETSAYSRALECHGCRNFVQ